MVKVFNMIPGRDFQRFNQVLNNVDLAACAWDGCLMRWRHEPRQVPPHMSTVTQRSGTSVDQLRMCVGPDPYNPGKYVRMGCAIMPSERPCFRIVSVATPCMCRRIPLRRNGVEAAERGRQGLQNRVRRADHAQAQRRTRPRCSRPSATAGAREGASVPGSTTPTSRCCSTPCTPRSRATWRPAVSAGRSGRRTANARWRRTCCATKRSATRGRCCPATQPPPRSLRTARRCSGRSRSASASSGSSSPPGTSR